jgi:hypothetical protein
MIERKGMVSTTYWGTAEFFFRFSAFGSFAYLGARLITLFLFAEEKTCFFCLRSALKIKVFQHRP